MRQLLEHEDFKKFPKLNQRVIDQMDEVLSQDIPRLMKQLGNHLVLVCVDAMAGLVGVFAHPPLHLHTGQETFVKGLDVDGPDVTGGGGAGGGAGAGVGGSVTMGGVVMGTAPPDDDLGLPVPVRTHDEAKRLGHMHSPCTLCGDCYCCRRASLVAAPLCAPLTRQRSVLG